MKYFNKSSFLTTLKSSSFILLVLIIFFIFITNVLLFFVNMNNHLSLIESSYMKNKKNILKSQINQVVSTIYYRKELQDKIAKDIIKSRVNQAYEIMMNICNESKGEISDREIKEKIKKYLRDIRFEYNGYYFITSVSGIEILFPDRPELEGKNLIKMKDIDGKYVIKDMINIVTEKGSGFYSYKWTKPGKKQNNYKKISYVQLFEPYDWIIGTGVYFKDIEENLKQELLNEIGDIRFGNDNNYIFVVSYDGVTLMNDTQREIIGKNIWDMEDPNGVKVIQEERKVAEKPGGDFIYYSWNKPETNKIEEKISFVRGVKEWGWMIGTGLYIDDLQDTLNIAKKEESRRLIYILLINIIVMLIVFLIYLYFVKLMSGRLILDFRKFISFFRNISEHKEIDISSIEYEEFKKIGNVANKMLNDKIKVEDELLKVANRFFIIFNTITDGVITINPDYTISYVNLAAKKILGYEEKTIKGKLAYKIVHYQNIEKLFDIRNLINEHLILDTPDELTIINNNEETKILEYLASPIFDNNGIYRGYVISFRDIQEKRRLQREMELNNKIESLGVLAGGIAHDFNNLLVGIFGHLDLLKMDLEKINDKDVKEEIEIVENTMERTVKLTNQLLTFSKGGKPNKENVNIISLLKEIVSFSVRGTDIKYEIISNYEKLMLYVDKGQMSQVFSNIIINSIKAIDNSGRIIVSIDLCRMDNKDYITISIKDNGIGIDKSKIDNIFDPYFTTKENGHGLGLAIVRSIVYQHEGSIKVESEEGVGTEFKILLPKDFSKSTLYNDGEQDIEIKFNNSYRFLIIDDEKVIVKMLVKLLEKYDQKVVSVNSAEEGLKQIEANKFDIVITDNTMKGGMSGIELSKIIRKKNTDIKIILSSGYMENNIGYGINEFIKKPYKLHDLLIIIKKLLE